MLGLRDLYMVSVPYRRSPPYRTQYNKLVPQITSIVQFANGTQPSDTMSGGKVLGDVNHLCKCIRALRTTFTGFIPKPMAYRPLGTI